MEPSVKDIESIFSKLKLHPANKSCFDCGAKNPTWASVTYGVFICIDCSAVHRSLGVHLTFVRSINLDTNWTWKQLKQMQLGGNAKASLFFRQHNCDTSDAQLKYNSRAAQLYRDKLYATANESLKECDVKDTLTTRKHEKEDSNIIIGSSINVVDSSAVNESSKLRSGIQKIQSRRPSGIKKGMLGAVKVKSNFSDIEKKSANWVKKGMEVETTAEIPEICENLILKKISEEEKLKVVDPIKAQQFERLGIAFNVKGNVSHSVINDMKIISEENPKSAVRDSGSELCDYIIFDECSTPINYSCPESQSCLPKKLETIHTIDTQKNIVTMFSTDLFNKGDSGEQLKEKKRSQIKVYEDSTAQKKFGNAKGISSAQFFETDKPTVDCVADLSRFQHSNSISSSEYFNETSTNPTKQKSYVSTNYIAPDLEDVKESVRHGVTKVAERLGSLANDVMSSIQDKCGY